MNLAVQSPSAELPTVSDNEAAELMTRLGIDSTPDAIANFKRLGTYLIEQDVGACQLAKSFDSDSQIAFAIEVARELAQNTEPEVRAKGVQALLQAVKVRAAVSEQAVKLAAASKGRQKHGNRPPIFNGPVTVVSQPPAIPV